MNGRVPSTALLRAISPFATPASSRSPQCLRTVSQTRALSGWTPRKNFAKVTKLDRLHRAQRDARIQERVDSQLRAQSITFAPSNEIKPVVADQHSLFPTTPARKRATANIRNVNLTTPPEPSTVAAVDTIADTEPDFASAQKILLPYLVTRTTPAKKLPVYEDTRGGGTKHITIVRRLSGDIAVLAEHLREALDLHGGITDRKGRKKEYITINWTTKQVVIRGWRGAEVTRWLELAGF